MNMFKNNGGFTLVELIVVIAILAILAGVAVPVYSGYISKANEAADLTQMDSLKTAAMFSVMEDHPAAKVTSISVTVGADKVVSSVVAEFEGCTDCDETTATVTSDVQTLMGGTLPKFQSNNTSAEWTDDSAKWELN